MSAAAVNEVTRAMRVLLRSQLVNVSPGAVVTLLPPGTNLPEATGVNLYLYRVTEPAFSRNERWPGDRVTPPSNGPALGLQLQYLLTPLGQRPDNASFSLGDDAHLMLGVAMRTLFENPILNAIHIPGFDSDVELPAFLRNAYDKINVTLMPTTMDELSKIWSTINQPYRLSVAYEVSMVFLAPQAQSPAGAGIVLRTGVEVIALDPPRLSSLTPIRGALATVTAGGAIVSNALVIDGFGLTFPGQPTLVRVGSEPATISASPAPTATSLTVSLPAALSAGPEQDVRVTVNGRTSTPLVFAVRPWISTMTRLRTALDPALPQDLAVTLDGLGFTVAPLEARFEGPGPAVTSVPNAGGTDTQAAFPIPAGLANGLYNVRLVLNDVLAGGAHSVSNTRLLEVIPLVTSIVAAVVTVGSAQVHQLTVTGARLNGADVRLTIDGEEYATGANANAAQLVHTLGRQLTAGTHAVNVSVDGRSSRQVNLVI